MCESDLFTSASEWQLGVSGVGGVGVLRSAGLGGGLWCSK